MINTRWQRRIPFHGIEAIITRPWMSPGIQYTRIQTHLNTLVTKKLRLAGEKGEWNPYCNFLPDGKRASGGFAFFPIRAIPAAHGYDPPSTGRDPQYPARLDLEDSGRSMKSAPPTRCGS